MIRIGTYVRTGLFLGGLCVFTSGLFVELDISPIVLDRSAQDPQAPAAVDTRPARQTDDSLLGVITARPLFEPGRRPFVSEPVKPAEEILAPIAAPIMVEPSPIQIKLVGIVGGNGSLIALVRLGEEGRTQWLRQGDSLDTMTVRSIMKDRVLFHCARHSCPEEIRLHGGQDGPEE